VRASQRASARRFAADDLEVVEALSVVLDRGALKLFELIKKAMLRAWW